MWLLQDISSPSLSFPQTGQTFNHLVAQLIQITPRRCIVSTQFYVRPGADLVLFLINSDCFPVQLFPYTLSLLPAWIPHQPLELVSVALFASTFGLSGDSLHSVPVSTSQVTVEIQQQAIFLTPVPLTPCFTQELLPSSGAFQDHNASFYLKPHTTHFSSSAFCLHIGSGHTHYPHALQTSDGQILSTQQADTGSLPDQSQNPPNLHCLRHARPPSTVSSAFLCDVPQLPSLILLLCAGSILA